MLLRYHMIQHDKVLLYTTQEYIYMGMQLYSPLNFHTFFKWYHDSRYPIFNISYLFKNFRLFLTILKDVTLIGASIISAAAYVKSKSLSDHVSCCYDVTTVLNMFIQSVIFKVYFYIMYELSARFGFLAFKQKGVINLGNF